MRNVSSSCLRQVWKILNRDKARDRCKEKWKRKRQTAITPDESVSVYNISHKYQFCLTWSYKNFQQETSTKKVFLLMRKQTTLPPGQFGRLFTAPNRGTLDLFVKQCLRNPFLSVSRFSMIFSNTNLKQMCWLSHKKLCHTLKNTLSCFQKSM